MSPIHLKEDISNSLDDIKISWFLLKSNWKAFIATELFALFSLAIVALLFTMIYSTIGYVIPLPSLFLDSSSQQEKRGFPLFFFGMIFFLSFLNCQYGLAYDIISSGDMFAEFKGSFTYFKRNWFPYSLLPFLLVSLHSLFQGIRIIWIIFIGDVTNIRAETNEFDLLRSFIFGFIFFVLLVSTLPSVTAQAGNSKIGRLKQGFIENFRLVKRRPRKLFSTLGLYYIIFNLPSTIISLFIILFYDSLIGSIWLIIIFSVYAFLLLLGILIGTPISTLIVTRIYSDAKLRGELDIPLKNTNDINNNSSKEVAE